ncbi:MAG: class I SAM-dependent methyltransferase [Verrucomicrobiales bacterium]
MSKNLDALDMDYGKHPDFLGSRVIFDSEKGYHRTEPYPTEEVLEKFYSSDYRKIRNESPDEGYLQFMKHRAEAQSKFIFSRSARDRFSTVLDVGCGCGELLAALKPKAAKLVGFETDVVMSNHAKKHCDDEVTDIRTEHFSFQDKSLSADLVVMSHVLEHIPHPEPFLSELRTTTLSPEGVLFLEVPNEPEHWVRKQIEWKRTGLGHVNYFTPDPLRRLLERAGFKRIEIRETGKTVREHVAKSRPRPVILRKIQNRLHRIIPPQLELPAYDKQGGAEPRIFLQVIAFASKKEELK